MQIIYAGKIIGESDDVLLVGREHYFPEHAVDRQYLVKNSSVLHCPDKGYATCYDIIVESATLYNVAWEYPHPYPLAQELKGKIGFSPTLFQGKRSNST